MIEVRFFCVYRVLFLWNFGILLRDLVVVAKFGCHIDKDISL